MRPKKIQQNETFNRHYNARIAVDRLLVEQFNKQIMHFLQDRTSLKVLDHPLHWDMQGLRAFSINKDIRVVYEETDDAYIFRDIGTHNQVYKQG